PSVVGGVRVPALDPCHGRVRELAFDREYGLRLRASLVGRVSEEPEHLGQVLTVLVPNLLRLLVGLYVVVPVGKAEPALADGGDDLAGILSVLLGSKGEKGRHSPRLETRHFRFEFGEALDFLDPSELGFDRAGSGGFDRSLVHAARVEIAELLLFRARGIFLLRELLQYLAQRLTVSVGELGKRAPSGELGRDRVLLQPASVGVLVEIVA